MANFFSGGNPGIEMIQLETKLKGDSLVGKKLEAVEQKIMLAFEESLNKLRAPAHKNDQFENGYATALQDVKNIIASLK